MLIVVIMVFSPVEPYGQLIVSHNCHYTKRRFLLASLLVLDAPVHRRGLEFYFQSSVKVVFKPVGTNGGVVTGIDAEIDTVAVLQRHQGE